MNDNKPASNAKRSPIDQRRKTGEDAESLAIHVLKEKGYQIEQRNWRFKRGEIDIVAVHNDILVFVEVRSRHRSGRFGTAAESVDYRKRNKLKKLAQAYLTVHRQHDRKIRFDVIAITLGGTSPTVDHIIEAF